MTGAFGGFIGGLLILGSIILVIMWICVPIFVYQIKKILERQEQETQDTKRLIRQVVTAIERQSRL